MNGLSLHIQRTQRNVNIPDLELFVTTIALGSTEFKAKAHINVTGFCADRKVTNV